MKNRGSEKDRQAKNGGAEGGSWCKREFHQEEDEAKIAKVGWTRGKNGMGTADEESACAYSGDYKDKRKSETKMGGLREERFGGSGRGGEGRMRTRDRGKWKKIGGDGSETGLVMKTKGKQSMTGIGASLTRTTGIKMTATTYLSSAKM